MLTIKALIVGLCIIAAATEVSFVLAAGAKGDAVLTAGAKDDALVMGIFPRRNAKVTAKLFKPIAKYLSRQLQREVKFVTAKDFKEFWVGVTEQQYDLVHYNQYHYLVSHKKFGYQVILKNEEFGSAKIGGAITIRKDSGINSVQDLKGKKIAFGGGPKAMMSYIVPTYLLRKAGLQENDYQTFFAKNPPNAVFATYFEQYDAAGAGDVVIKLVVVKKRIDTEKMKYLITSKPITHLPWAVRKGIAPSLRDKIQQALLNLNNTPEGKKLLKGAGLTGLIKAVDAEYDPHREIANEVFGESY